MGRTHALTGIVTSVHLYTHSEHISAFILYAHIELSRNPVEPKIQNSYTLHVKLSHKQANYQEISTQNNDSTIAQGKVLNNHSTIVESSLIVAIPK